MHVWRGEETPRATRVDCFKPATLVNEPPVKKQVHDASLQMRCQLLLGSRNEKWCRDNGRRMVWGSFWWEPAKGRVDRPAGLGKAKAVGEALSDETDVARTVQVYLRHNAVPHRGRLLADASSTSLRRSVVKGPHATCLSRSGQPMIGGPKSEAGFV